METKLPITLLLRAALLLAVVPVGSLLPVAVMAEVPPTDDAELERGAELVATGQVVSVSVRNEVTKLEGLDRKPEDLVTAHYTVVMAVDSVKKGTLPDGLRQISFVGDNIIQMPRGLVGNTGTLRITLHRGDHISVYLARMGGEWALFHYMGIKVLP